jgi:hypothetical protein
MRPKALAFALSLSQLATANAACDAQAEGSPSYERAAKRVEALPEYKKWRSFASERPGVHAARLPMLDRQVSFGRHCYWSVSAYSNEGTHMHLWQTFLVDHHSGRILVQDLEGMPVSLAAWRAKQRVATQRKATNAL